MGEPPGGRAASAEIPAEMPVDFNLYRGFTRQFKGFPAVTGN
jgi:hypothetical protein